MSNPIDDLPDQNAPSPLDDFKVTNPNESDVIDEIESLEGYKEFLRHSDNENLTFGDY